MISTIIDSVSSIVSFFQSIFSLLWTVITILPYPFNAIFNTYFGVGIVLYLWKVYKGG